MLCYSGSPVSRWASIAFGAGVGFGSAYIESSYMFGGSPPKCSAPKVSGTPPAPVPAPAPAPAPSPAPAHVRFLDGFIIFNLLCTIFFSHLVCLASRYQI